MTGERGGSTLENIVFGAALVLFLVVGYFAAKRFGVIPSRAPAAIAPAPSGPGVPFRVGLDDQPAGRKIVGRDAGPAVTSVPALKGARPSRKRRRTVVPNPR